MKITVIICTFNRCRDLGKALDSVAVSQLPESVQWEVLVVDNNSSDQTRKVVEDCSDRFPGRFRYLFESRQGKSHALNAGVREAQGDILAFMDDDVTVEPTWLRNLTAVLDNREWAGSGGRTLLAQPFSPPPWLSADEPYTWGAILAGLFDLGDKTCELGMAPYGTNMAFQKRMFEKYGGFRTDLGPSPSREIPRPNEDTEFGRRLLAAGERLRYEPFAIVYHPVVEARVQREYFLNWWFDYGRAVVREENNRPSILGIVGRCLRILGMAGARLPIRTVRWLCSLDPERRFSRKCRVWMACGQILEMYRIPKNQENYTLREASRSCNARTQC